MKAAETVAQSYSSAHRKLCFFRICARSISTARSCWGADDVREGVTTIVLPSRTSVGLAGMARACLRDEHDVEGIIRAAPDSSGSGDLVLPLLKHLALDSSDARVAA